MAGIHKLRSALDSIFSENGSLWMKGRDGGGLGRRFIIL